MLDPLLLSRTLSDTDPSTAEPLGRHDLPGARTHPPCPLYIRTGRRECYTARSVEARRARRLVRPPLTAAARRSIKDAKGRSRPALAFPPACGTMPGRRSPANQSSGAARGVARRRATPWPGGRPAARRREPALAVVVSRGGRG